MTPTIIARTQEQASHSEDGVFWIREFRIIKKEIGFVYSFILEDRYLSRIGDKWYARLNAETQLFTDPETTWHHWTQGETAEAAIDDVIGQPIPSAYRSGQTNQGGASRKR